MNHSGRLSPETLNKVGQRHTGRLLKQGYISPCAWAAREQVQSFHLHSQQPYPFHHPIHKPGKSRTARTQHHIVPQPNQKSNQQNCYHGDIRNQVEIQGREGGQQGATSRSSCARRRRALTPATRSIFCWTKTVVSG